MEFLKVHIGKKYIEEANWSLGMLKEYDTVKVFYNVYAFHFETHEWKN